MSHEVGPELDAYEDALLVNAVGGAYGGGAGRGAQRLKKDVLEIELSLSVPRAQAEARAREVLSTHCRATRDVATGDGPVRIAGILGSGALNMNPTVVMITISESAGGSRVTVRGAAKEGLLFKQKAGQKAARRIADAMVQPASSPLDKPS
jgi:hypothetical protein